MIRKETGFRITKIGKTAVSVAIGGLMVALSQGASATSFNITNGGTPIPTITGNTNSVEIYSSTNANPYSGSIPITLNAGVNLTGQVVVGNTPWAIFTSKHAGNQQWVRFGETSVDSTLNLQGNNDITGVVGWNIDFPANNANTADVLDTINVNGTGVSLNSAVYANVINLNQGGTLQFFGNIDGTDTTLLRYNGHNATVTLHNGITLDGSITNTVASNGSLILNLGALITGSVGSPSEAIQTVRVQGQGSSVTIGGMLATDNLNYEAASTVRIGGSLDLDNIDGVNAVTFNQHDGTLQVGGDIVGVVGKAAVKNTGTGAGGNTPVGTLTMFKTGDQSITGHIGESSKSIKLFNVGGTGIDTGASNTNVTGHVYASSVSLNNSSTLTMNSGYSLTGAVTTELPQTGTLILAGGAQTLTGTVGTSGVKLAEVRSGENAANATFTGVVNAVNVVNSGTGTSNFNADVNATNINVGAGTSNFASNVTATTTTIGTGTGNFNTGGGVTTSGIVFSGAGTANLNQGLTGTVSFGSNQATVNLADTMAISGTISASTANHGILNALGAATLNNDVGVSAAIKELNINTTGPTSKTVLANGHVSAETISLRNDGELAVADTKNVVGNISTASPNTGILSLAGTHSVTGAVGQDGTALRQINAGASGSTVNFNNGVVYANTLNYTGNGTVQVNGLNHPAPVGHSPSLFTSGASDHGFVGNVDFGNGGEGTFRLGNNVDLSTQATRFINANAATLTFVGNSVVTGQLGSVVNGQLGNDTFRTINAGSDGSTVTFRENVFVSANTFHVTGSGTVNFMGDLNGPLVFDANANGQVNVASGKNINGVVTTLTNDSGTLNFVGNAALQAPIGMNDPLRYLRAVNFHAHTSDPFVSPVLAGRAIVNIGQNVYATTTTIGNSANPTTANITATGKFLGNNLTLSSGTTLNTAGAVVNNTLGAVANNTAISLVDFVHTKVVDGSLTNTGTVTKSRTGTGAITVNDGAKLNFAVGTSNWAANAGGGTINPNASSGIHGDQTQSTLVFNTAANNVNVSLLGSLRNNQTYSLIDVASGANTAIVQPPNDNSFVIDTELSRSNGDLLLTASRAVDQYIVKSGTRGDISNAAALRLGTLAANGTAYTSDVQTVLNMLDIDQWGFGNNATNLATQAKRLAPIANNSLNLGALDSTSIVGDSLGMRMHQLRIPETAKPYDAKGVWARTINGQSTQRAAGAFDGYKSAVTGLAFGVDAYPNRNSLVGAAFSYTTNKVSQQDVRLGDTAAIQGSHLSLYGAYNLTPELFVDATATGSWFSTQGNRQAVVGRNAQFDFDRKAASGKVNLGYRFKLGQTASYLTPLMSYQHTLMSQPGYAETGAGDIGLVVAGQNRLNHKQAALGLRFEGTYLAAGMVVKPDLSIMSTKTGGDYSRGLTTQFAGDLTNTAAFGTPVYRDGKSTGVRLSMGLGLLMNKTTAMSVRYNMSQSGSRVGGEGHGLNSSSLDLAVRWNF